MNETRMSDGKVMARRDAPIGGQAILEGVMMRGIRTWATAVRKPIPEQQPESSQTSVNQPTQDQPRTQTDSHQTPKDEGEIEIQTFSIESWAKKHRLLRLPIIRGVVALAESMKIGFKALNISANAQLPEEQEPLSGGAWVGTILVALVFAIGLFFVVPVGATSLIKDQLGSSLLFWLVEGVLRTAIFLGYLLLISRLRDLRRVFEYHGAEHKTIACYEASDELTPEHAQKYSRLHPRCGTSFLFIVIILAIFIFAPIGLPAWYWLLLSRIVGVPLLAGISFEIIKWMGRNRNKDWVRALMWPGLQLQRLTTRPPDLSQLAVAIAALQAVLAKEKPGTASADDLLGAEISA